MAGRLADGQRAAADGTYAERDAGDRSRRVQHVYERSRSGGGCALSDARRTWRTRYHGAAEIRGSADLRAAERANANAGRHRARADGGAAGSGARCLARVSLNRRRHAFAGTQPDDNAGVAMAESERQDTGLAAIRSVPLAAPFGWLKAGLADALAHPGPSLFYGLCFALMGAAIYVTLNHAYQYVSALVTGFFIVGPFLAIGLYDL